jgi:aerobic carbon-monoxide dehydrogenase medium subunit
MIPASFDYHAPRSLDEAVALLQRLGEGAKVLSGGQSLLPLMKLRLGQPEHLVDIGRIPDLEYIREEGGYLRIGGRTREAALDRSELIHTRYPIIADTAAVIADPLVRNLATVGGNLAHGDPANDHPATMLALGAKVVALGPRGTREIAIEDFFVGLFSTALGPDEILTEIRIPVPAPRSAGAYLKLERKVGDFATAGVAVQLALGKQGEVERAGIGLTNAGPMPVKASEAERFLAGRRLDGETIAQAAEIASRAANPSPDRRGSAEYKKDMARVLTARAIRLAGQRAEGSQP